MSMLGSIGKTTVHLFRDCLRLAHYIASNSPKGHLLKATIRSSFKRHKNETDPVVIESLKGNAVRALANYLMVESGLRDSKLKKSLDAYSESEAESVKHS